MRTIVRGGRRLTDCAVRQAVAPEDCDRFARLVADEFKSLHAGNAVRFGLGPLALDAWPQRQGAA